MKLLTSIAERSAFAIKGACVAAMHLLGFQLRMEAQGAAPSACALPSGWSEVGARISVAHTLNTKDVVAQPAFVQLTVPDTGASYITAALAARFELCSTSQFSLGSEVEYFGEGAEAKRANSLRIGIGGDWSFRATGQQAAAWTPNLAYQLGFKSDRVKNTESVQALALLSTVGRNSSRWLAPNTVYPWRGHTLTWSPQLGVVAERVYKGTTERRTGTIVAAVAQVSASIFPFDSLLGGRAEIFGTYVGQSALVGASLRPRRSYDYARFGLNLFLIRDTRTRTAAGFTVMRTTGEDPLRSTNRLAQWQVGANLRIN